MPVIRLTPTAPAFRREQRQALLDQLSRELAGQATEKGPVVFEIPLDQTDKMDVLVVWEAWKDVPSEIRSDVILEAYKDKKDTISQALGVTYQEANDQNLLPYAVLPMARRGEVDPETLKAAMLKQGGFALEGGKVDLRFPTRTMAQEAHRRLCDEVSKGYWSMVQSGDAVS
jgi:hypothetical protein